MKVVVIIVESLLYHMYFNLDILPANFLTFFQFRVRDFEDVFKLLLKIVILNV